MRRDRMKDIIALVLSILGILYSIVKIFIIDDFGSRVLASAFFILFTCIFVVIVKDLLKKKK